MKPERLEMSGFAPFRAMTVVDFRDLELFALTGPTGAGKSSVIDAITFALYGSVPRYDRKSVEPVISLGAAEARIRFDFEVEGASHTVARVVRRTASGGATTAEARLESGGTTLASGAAEVTKAVESLIGLGIDHFTRSVVLPQGEFAAFLHDTPSGQQDLVKALLDMGVLEVVRRSAAERVRTASALAQSARVRLEHLCDATEEAEQAVSRRLEDLEKLEEPVLSGEEAVAEAQVSAREIEGRLAQLRRQRVAVGEVEAPEGVMGLAKDVAEAQSRLEAATAARVAAGQALHEVVEESRGVPTGEQIEAARRTAEQLAAALRKVESFDLDRLEVELTAAGEATDSAERAREEATVALEQARRRHTAHALVAGHTAGDPCPVCGAPLPEEPGPPPADLEETESTLAEKAEEHRAAVLRHREAESAVASARAGHEAAVETMKDLEERAAGLPADADLDALAAARREVDQRLKQAGSRVEDSGAAEVEARRLRDQLEARAADAWDAYATERDRVASLAPPPSQRRELSEAWTTLMAWVESERSRLDDEIVTTSALAEEAEATIAKLREELEVLLTENGVEGTGSPSARLAATTATVRAEHARVRERRAERAVLTAEMAAFDERAQVATSLANHLRANHFEGWLLAEALETLVEGANVLLAELTSGAYSLALHERTIEVVDHRNADERRSVRSLSGGETFLVSLALALSLGEQLVTLSDRGGARLEAIFLDEGFGTLDAETLETVSVVVAELAAGGRAVGLVTHVKDLADQIPVRFEVRAGPSGSTIQRVES